MPPTTDARSAKATLDAARGAVLATHAAAGLASGQREAVRLIRAAEGLLRTAVAVLATPSSPALVAAPLADPAASSRRRRRPRGRGGSKGGDENGKHYIVADGMDIDKGSAGEVATGAGAPPQPMLEDDAWADELPVVMQARGPPASTDQREGKGKNAGKGGESGGKGKLGHLEVWQLRNLVVRLRERAGLPPAPETAPFDHGVLVAMAVELEELAASSDGTRGGGSGAAGGRRARGGPRGDGPRPGAAGRGRSSGGGW